MHILVYMYLFIVSLDNFLIFEHDALKKKTSRV